MNDLHRPFKPASLRRPSLQEVLFQHRGGDPVTPSQFAQLVESIRQAGRIRRGEVKPAREFILPAAIVEILQATAAPKRPRRRRGDPR